MGAFSGFFAEACQRITPGPGIVTGLLIRGSRRLGPLPLREKVASSILEGGPVRDGEVKLAPVLAAYVVGVALFLALAGLPALC